jgi:hypothetical protein
MALPPKLQSGVEFARALLATLRDPQFMPVAYPSLFAEGVLDGSLHATMLSALVLAGDRLGFMPICDAPIFDDLDLALTSDASKRPDAVWIDRNTRSIRCLLEFERYAKRSLVPKAQNLMVMGKAAGQGLGLAVLAYWSYEHIPLQELAVAAATFTKGFVHPSGTFFEHLDCVSLVLEVQVMTLASRRVALGQITPRIAVAAGEEKPYLLDEWMA